MCRKAMFVSRNSKTLGTIFGQIDKANTKIGAKIF